MTAELLTCHQDSLATLCLNDDLTTISFAAFWQDVWQQAALLRALPAAQFALWQQDSYDFLVLLLACVAADKPVRLPPNRVAALEQQWAQQGVSFLERQPIDSSLLVTRGLSEAQWLRPSLGFHTSGSTGESKCIPRSLSQLCLEVQTLAQSLPLADQALALASVSHQHIYGLLFKLLLPLVTGRSFYRPQLAFPEDIAATQRMTAPLMRNYVVASPALLKRWSADVALSHCEWVSSSGGPLAAGVRQLVNSPLVEVFGSSETGGIACRWQDGAVWQPLAGVALQLDGSLLLVKSPHAYTDDWIVTGDQAELSVVDGHVSGLNLLGRADRLIKLEEKRISLDAVERELTALADIEQCHITVLQHGQRQLLGAVLVPTAVVRAALQSGELSKAAWIQQLKTQLAQAVESVALPRQWRIVSALPCNSQAKLDRQYLHSLFQTMQYPVVVRSHSTESQAQFQLDFPPELQCFAGHFPQQPIYPGVGQIAFVQQLAKQVWPDLRWLCAMEQMKFQDLIRPFASLDLQLQRQGNKVNFQLTESDKGVASGRLLWQGAEEDGADV